MMKAGSIITTTATTNQVVLAYTIPMNRVFHLEYVKFQAIQTVVPGNNNPVLLGTISLIAPTGEVMHISNMVFNSQILDSISLRNLHCIAGGTIKAVCTPASVISIRWFATIGGVERPI